MDERRDMMVVDEIDRLNQTFADVPNPMQNAQQQQQAALSTPQPGSSNAANQSHRSATPPVINAAAIMQQMAQMNARMEQLQIELQHSKNELHDEQKARHLLEQRLNNVQPTHVSSNTPELRDEAIPVIGNIPLQSPLGSTSTVDACQASANLNPLQYQSSSVSSTLTHKPYDLPEFSGVPEQWPVFIAAFRQSTQAFGYSPLQNTFRLQKSLKGEAREIVEYLLISPDNVEQLITTLEFRFGRPEILAGSQMAKVRELPKIIESRIDQLITFSTRVTNMVAFLNTTSSSHVLSETTLLSELVAKLPQSKQLEWTMHSLSLGSRATVIEFAGWLKQIAQCVSILTASTQNQSISTGKTVDHNHHSKRPAKHVLLNVQSQSQSEDRCEVCRGAHVVARCDRFSKQTQTDRWATARRLQLCFRCLQSGHAITDCEEKGSGSSGERSPEFHDLLQNRSKRGSRKRKPVERASIDPATTSAAEKEPIAEKSDNQLSKRHNPFDRPSTQAAVLTCHNDPESKPPLFRILPVTLHGPSRKTETYALLDEGSALTLLDEDLSIFLELDGRKSNLSVQWIGNHATSEPSRTVQLQISGSSRRQFKLERVRTVSDLNLPSQSLDLSQLDDRMKCLPIEEYHNVTPKILIGLDHSRLGMSRHTVTSQHGGPIAAQTSLGWVMYGPQSSSSATVLHLAEIDRWDQLDDLIRRYMTTDHFGVKRPEQLLESDDDTRARLILQSTTKPVADRFQTGLLWRTDDIVLPDSLPMARQRLSTIEKKMARDATYRQLYTQQIEAYLEKGYARRLTPEEASIRTNRTWYLPHFGVQTISKPGKLRLVFDAAAKVGNTSLNSVLVKGPDLNQPLVNILFRFRLGRVAVCGDIAEMFSQVLIQPSDRESQRFLWRSNIENKEPDVYEMCVMTFGATCSPTSAQYVKNLNASRFESEFPEAARAIREVHYVDDYVASFVSEQDAIETTRDVVDIHKRGGFVLRGLISNSKQVLDKLGASSHNDIGVDLELDSNATDKILGLRWCTTADTFVFSMRFDRVDDEIIRGLRRPTKRELLSAAMSVFDPFGFIADYMLHTKIMVQTLWRLGVAWDEPVPDATFRLWKAWCNDIDRIKLFKIPRCYSPLILTSDRVELHLFADASEEAFSAVGYWRIEHECNVELSFIIGKVKCAPLKILSVPRLELQAAVLATRLCNTIHACHPNVKISRTVLWTDSRTVQQWIHSTTRRFRPFVAHRVSEILESTRATWWRWVPTADNVADDATRCRELPQFDPSSRWLRGPEFLLSSESSWPKIPTSTESPDPFPEEISARFTGIVIQHQPFIEINRFSKFLRLCRACAWALRFAHNARARQQGISKKSGELDVSEIGRATDILCRQSQRCGYPNEYAALESGRAIERSSPLLQMMPYFDDHKLIRLYGRTDAADAKYLPVDAQRPILLPRQDRFTELLVRYHHERMGHQFEDATICEIRRRYWVPHLRPLVRSVKNSCAACKIRSATPCPTIAGQLPPDRLTPHVPVFNFTGLDYFGPVSVTVGRRHEKRWIALFTCLTTRAVHMEVAQDLSTDACLLCIRNFCNLRGVPSRIRSDCGTNFVGADHEIRRVDDFIDQTRMQRELGTRGIEWLMNCPANPEAGGIWERLVQSAKRVLAVTLKEVAPRVETLRSLVIAAANILNSRPLTHIPVSPTDLEPITPNHFLLGRTNSTTTAGPIDKKQLCSRKQWHVHQQMMRTFWNRWVQDYLPELTRRTKHHKDVDPIAEGALVLICDANQSRGQWLRGKVERVVVGTDGRVRTAEVRTNKGVVRRPISKLAILDVE